METKQIKISELVPQGYEIDKEQSTFENIILKPIEVKLPLSVYTIPNRNYCIDEWGNIRKCLEIYSRNYLSTENRAKAFLALMQLVELRDAWNEGWKPDWKGENNFTIKIYCDNVKIEDSFNFQRVLYFKSEELAEKFAEQFKDLINEAKELL